MILLLLTLIFSLCPLKNIVVYLESLKPLHSPEDISRLSLSPLDSAMSSTNKPLTSKKVAVPPSMSHDSTSAVMSRQHGSDAAAWPTSQEIGIDASTSFLVHKCITVLARQTNLCLQLTNLRKELTQNIPNVDEKILIELCVQHSHLFGLYQAGSINTQRWLGKVSVDNLAWILWPGQM